MSGVLLFLMGLFRLGTLIRFIPVAVVIGFTNGIAVLIMLTQIKDFLGLKVATMPADFFGILNALWLNLHTANLAALLLALDSALSSGCPTSIHKRMRPVKSVASSWAMRRRSRFSKRGVRWIWRRTSERMSHALRYPLRVPWRRSLTDPRAGLSNLDRDPA